MGQKRARAKRERFSGKTIRWWTGRIRNRNRCSTGTGTTGAARRRTRASAEPGCRVLDEKNRLPTRMGWTEREQSGRGDGREVPQRRGGGGGGRCSRRRRRKGTRCSGGGKVLERVLVVDSGRSSGHKFVSRELDGCARSSSLSTRHPQRLTKRAEGERQLLCETRGKSHSSGQGVDGGRLRGWHG